MLSMRCSTIYTIMTVLMFGLSACGPGVPFVPDQSRLPPGALGGSNINQDVAAVNQAQWAFALSDRTHGRPIEAARAAASMDYIAGQLYASPRWAHISALTKEQLLQGREEVRAALGVAPGAKSQQVVNSLIAASNALVAGDQAEAERDLGPPVYTVGGAQVLARLSNLPYLQSANISTTRALNELFQNDRGIFKP